jgi:hypothetical protein
MGPENKIRSIGTILGRRKISPGEKKARSIVRG